MRTPTITVYKDGDAIVIDPSEKDQWSKQGYKAKPGRPKKTEQKKDDGKDY